MEARLQIDTGYAEIEGARLYYEVAGTGHPLLLIHADVADCRMWDEQFAALAQRYRVIRFDKRGFGRSTSENGAFSHRQDIVGLLEHLNVERTAVLGLSNGGMIAIDFALEHPEMVDALIVVAAGVSGHQPSATDAEMRLFGEWEKLEEQKDTEGLTELAVNVFVDGPVQPKGRADTRVRERVREMITDNNRLHTDELQEQPLEPPAVGRLGEIRVPTLVVVGDLDETGTVATMDMLAERVDGARIVHYPDAAHMVNMEKPEEFNQLVLDFLARL